MSIISANPQQQLPFANLLFMFVLKRKLGTMIINKEARRVTINKKECLLRNAEFNLLCMFAEKSNHTLSREEIKNAF